MDGPRFSQRIDPMLIKLLIAIESVSAVMVVTIMLNSGVGQGVVLLTVLALAAPIVLLSCAVLRIRLDDDRLRWSFFPMWRSAVRYEDIESIEVIRVEAMRDFGGWGVKLGRGAFGAIARSGPGLRVVRRNTKRDLVLTCDDAEALAQAVHERAPRAAIVGEPWDGS